MVQGLPDWTKGISVNVAAESAEYPTVIGARPQGTTRVFNSVTPTGVDWEEIVSYTPPNGYRFYIAKAVAFTLSAYSRARVKLDAEIIGEGVCTADAPYFDFFPFGVYLDGDDTKKVTIEVYESSVEMDGILMGELVEL